MVPQSARGRGLAYFVDGVRSGTAALVGNTVFAFSNATTKMSGAVRKGLLTIGLDQPLAEPGERTHYDTEAPIQNQQCLPCSRVCTGSMRSMPAAQSRSHTRSSHTLFGHR